MENHPELYGILYALAAVLILGPAVFTYLNFGHWLVQSISFWIEFKSWPAKDPEMKAIQKKLVVMPVLQGLASDLDKAFKDEEALQKRMRESGVSYKEFGKQLGEIRLRKENAEDKFRHAQNAAQEANFGLNDSYKTFLPS
ncbi:hypothetical protein A2886_02105 [candidate division WWE3 bacterium RIFCSPHIGHO2_01_FULL_42_13]|uniref:Uncharacterized protein n=1 Tax=candidate division WWE3 bacterium RIFCSPHIGHO2_01_FULL_42_13 TaxID=1802617 RepID=A0A1F4URG1_UNCKA|nr:MAG: hypothetical protein A2886_02105 [candidate division WWE3 bacterium RIFCSPHIGHO2_01_FULL_42_13]